VYVFTVLVLTGLAYSSKTGSKNTPEFSVEAETPVEAIGETVVFVSLLNTTGYLTTVTLAADPPVTPLVDTPVTPPVAAAPVFGVPSFPNTPSPNNSPIIKASKTKIPKSGQNHAGHPPFLDFALVYTTGFAIFDVLASTLTSPV